jgi:DNA-binding SARP family transcriptional activator
MKLFVKYIGRVGFRVNGETVTEQFSEKSKGILLYMVLNNKEYHRNQLKQLFWCDFSEASANRNLRHAIWNIRKVFRTFDSNFDALINISKSIIKLNESLVIERDLDYFDALMEQKNISKGEIINCLENFGQDFLENFFISDSQDFNNWVYFERESFRRKYFNRLLLLAQKFMTEENYSTALKILNNLVLLDSYNESLYLMIMKLHVKNGNKSYAVHTYNEAKRVLREELNLGLSKEMKDYYELISKSVNEKKDLAPTQLTIDLKKIINSNHKMTILMTNQVESINQFKYDFLAFNNKPLIELSKIPGRRLPYEGVFEFIDEYVHLFQGETAIQELNNISAMKTKHIDALVLFNQLSDFLKKHQREEIIVVIYNLAYMDDKFIDFVSYIYRKGCSHHMKFIIAYNKNWETSRIKFFIDAMGIMDDINIIEG